MDYLRYLREHDDPTDWMESADFDYESAQAKFNDFVGTLSTVLGTALEKQTGLDIQDASFHSQVIFPAPPGQHPSIRFSSFGNMVTVIEPENVRNEWLRVVEQMLEQSGYVYVPENVLKQPYTGTNPGVEGIPDWLTRYFGWV